MLLGPPLLWIGVVYVGSLLAFLLNSFYGLDEFSGLIDYRFTLSTFAQLLQRANFDIIVRSVLMATAVTLASAVIAFPVSYYAARYARGKWKAFFYLARHDAAVVELSGKIYAWKLILAKEGILTWLAETYRPYLAPRRALALPVIGGPSLVHQLHRHVPGLRLCLASLYDPSHPGGPRACSLEPRRRIGRSRRQPPPGVPHRHPASGAARTYRRIDLHLLADAWRLHHSSDHRHLALFIGQAVYAQQGTAGNIPLAAAFTVVPIVIMGTYLWIAKRMGAFDAL